MSALDPVLLNTIAVEPASLRDAIDPAEHAAHSIIDACADLDKELAICASFDRAVTVKQLIVRAFKELDRIDLKASDVIGVLSHKKGAA